MFFDTKLGESPLACGLGQGLALYEPKPKEKTHPCGCVFLLVEARRVELLSENLSTGVSPSAVYLLKFPFKTADKQAILKGIP